MTEALTRKHRPVDIADTLAKIDALLARYVVYPSDQARWAHVLWIVHTWLIECWQITPRIAFMSPEPGSGKTLCLDLSRLLVKNGHMAAAISPAAMRRMITPGNRPTFLADEIDLVFTKKNQDDGMSLMQVLNSGYTASGYYIGCNGPMQTPTTWSTYCAVGIAGLKNLPQALEQRTILIPMRKREPGVRVEKFRETRIPRDELKEIISGIRSWVAMVEPTVMSKEASYPDGHDGRTEDIWEPLLIIADMAGREWPSRVRESLEWCSRVEKKETIGVELLRDIKAVFVGAFMSSQDLTDTLNRLEESRWSDPNDTPLSARGVARLLAPYGVKPNPPRKIDGRAQRGYYRGDFVSAWKTYLPDGAESNRTTPPLDPWAEVLDANMSDYH